MALTASRTLVLRLQAQKCSAAAVSRSFSSAPDDGPVGFIGLGKMGAYMANNLLKKGFKVKAFDVSKDALQQVEKNGATIAKSLTELANTVTKVVTMLPSNQIVLDVYCKDDGLINNVKPGSLLIDSSTCDPQVMKDISVEAKKKGVNFVDGPVSGGTNGARLATLTFMIGGDKADYERAVPICKGMGVNIVHCGDIGAGQIAKICNNMLLGIHMIGTAECMNLGIKMGLDPKVLLGIVNSSSGRNWSSEVYCPVPNLMDNVPANNGYNGGFMAKLIAKDLGFASDLAAKNGCPVPLGNVANDMFETLKSKGLGDKDFSYVYEYFKGQGK